MKDAIGIVAEIPCFKCLFWEWKKDSHLYCNPNECQKLSDWLMKEAEKNQNTEASLTVETTRQVMVSERAQTE
jgi:hypothetical protein